MMQLKSSLGTFLFYFVNDYIDRRAERFYHLGFSLGKVIDLGNVINTVKYHSFMSYRFTLCFNYLKSLTSI